MAEGATDRRQETRVGRLDERDASKQATRSNSSGPERLGASPSATDSALRVGRGGVCRRSRGGRPSTERFRRVRRNGTLHATSLGRALRKFASQSSLGVKPVVGPTPYPGIFLISRRCVVAYPCRDMAPRPLLEDPTGRAQTGSEGDSSSPYGPKDCLDEVAHVRTTAVLLSQRAEDRTAIHYATPPLPLPLS